MKCFFCLGDFRKELHSTKAKLIFLDVFVLTLVRTIVFQLFERDLDRKNLLYSTTFDPQLFKSIFFLTQKFSTFTLSFMRSSADLPINQHDKDKSL